jgi:hypothetical protein
MKSKLIAASVLFIVATAVFIAYNTITSKAASNQSGETKIGSPQEQEIQGSPNSIKEPSVESATPLAQASGYEPSPRNPSQDLTNSKPLHPLMAEVDSQNDVLNGDVLKVIDDKARLDIYDGIKVEQEHREKLRSCKEYSNSLPGKPTASQTYKWDVVLYVESQENSGEIAKAELAPDSSWPPYFDEKTKTCFLEAFKGIKFATSHDFSYKLSWPIFFEINPVKASP